MSIQDHSDNLKTLVIVGVMLFGAASGSRAEEKLISVYSSGQTVQAVFQDVAQKASVHIVLDPDVKGTVDLSLKDFKLTSTLSAICTAASLEWEKSLPDQTGKDVYLIHRKKSAAEAAAVVVAAPPAAVAPAAAAAAVDADQDLPNKTKVSFGPPAAVDEAAKPAEKAKAADPFEGRELHLNSAQMRLVLNGVPNMKANSILNMWRQRGGGGGQFYSPGGPSVINNSGRPFGLQMPGVNYVSPYDYRPAASVRYYLPDGSVYGGNSGPSYRISPPAK